MTWHWRLLLVALFLIVLIIFMIWQFFIQTQFEDFAYEEDALIGSIPINYSSMGAKPLILVWTRIFREQSLRLDSDCPLHDKCLLTYDHSHLPRANAVIFHVPDIKWVHQIKGPSMSFDLPDLPDLPPYKKSEGRQSRVNVFLSQENPSVLARYYNANELSKKSHNYFHWVMSYMHSSHLPMPYGGFWVDPEQTIRHNFPPVHLPNDRETILKDKNKIKGILWFVSDCDTDSKRELAVQALAKHIPITIGGKCSKTTEGKQLCPRDTPGGCDHLYAEYYFYIAAENDICKDYVTEKYWNWYKFPIIPIVLRKRIYDGIVPNNSFIAMDQFKGPKEMAAYLQQLMDNPDAYLQYFEWRAQNWSIAPWNHEGFRIGQCALCERLLRLANSDELMPNAISDAVRWFEQNSKCEGGSFAEQWANNTD